MATAAIRVDGLGKRFRLGERERYVALRDVLARAVTAPFRRPAAANGNGRAHIWALRDVTLQVSEGDTVGIVGRNGAGKSTLLKILAGITLPTEGSAEVRGRVGSLLEVGTGFHPELTGRENIYFSGSILGMKRREIDRKFDEIVAFSGVESFLDTPLKHYSSGMQLRLAFSVAAHLEPEVLLVDEVLAVGDATFQKKCLGKMSDVARSGRTVLFVSHQLNQIRRLCKSVIWLEGGIRKSGTAAEVTGSYELAMTSGEGEGAARDADDNFRARFLRWGIGKPGRENTHLLAVLGPVEVHFVLKVCQEIHNGVFGVALFNSENQLIWGQSKQNLQLSPGVSMFRYSFPMLPLRPGPYTWQVSLWDDHGMADMWHASPEMIIATENHQHPLDEWNGVMNMPSEFSAVRGEER
ncbi:MAG TPA: ABC transporter ATP-binding protein [Bryobacteraceae bacterium]|nr:ABC transporter ATP-binding protein [Bryobacteraceae bacterium]